MSKYNFVKNCDIPEPPQSPIVVPDDSPINPLISLPLNPTIPLELIAKFLPCKYKGRFPCPEIKVENDGGPGGANSVTYNCIDKSELVVDFDIESYCCDVIEDEDGNPVDHDKIIMTAHSELTLPYPPLIYPGYLYYFDRLEVGRYIANYNATHVDQLSPCDRCWLQTHLAGIREWQRTSGLSDPNNYIWYVYTYDEDKDTRTTKQYLYPLINEHRRYYTQSTYFREEEKIIASLDRCTCKATILTYTTECIAVVGNVRGECNCSYAMVTAPDPNELPSPAEDVTGKYFWGIEPDYPVKVGAAFTGYLSKRDNLVYCHVPPEEKTKYTGKGTYQGNNYVTNITWRDASGMGFSSTTEIDDYNTAGNIPIGTEVVVEKTCEPCSGIETHVVENSDYRTTLPAAALGSSNVYGASISVNLYSGSGTAGPVVTAFNYAGTVQLGDRGFVSYSQGNYYFFKKGPADEAPGPVIHKGLRKHFSGLNGFDKAVPVYNGSTSSIIDPTEISTLTEAEKDLLVLGNRYSTVENISDEGTVEIDTISVAYTEDRSIQDPTYSCGYWAQKTIAGDPFNHDAYWVRNDADYVICKNSSDVEYRMYRTDTGKKKEIHIYDQSDPTQYTTISDVTDYGWLYGNSPVYGPFTTQYGNNSTDVFWDNSKFGPLGVTCEADDATVVDSELTGTLAARYYCTYKALDSNNNVVFTFTYNPIVQGYETTYGLLANSYEAKSDGLYAKQVPERCYTINSNNTATNRSSVGNSATVTLQDLLRGNNYRWDHKNNGYHIYPGKIILKDDSYVNPRKASSEETYHYFCQSDPHLNESVTFTFTLGSINQSAKTYTPLNIFNGDTSGWYSVKNLITYNGSKVLIDVNSKGIKPFFSGSRGTKELFYYWSPSVDLTAVTYTFKEFFKPTNEFVVNGREKTISLTDSWYPVEYNSTLNNYILSLGNTENRCYALYSSTGNVSLNQNITFTFTRVSGLDVTISMNTALSRANTAYWSSGNIYTKPNTPYYWTCPSKNIACDVIPLLPDLTIVTDDRAGSFTGYYWKVVNNS